jgi:hypothetical protein
MSEPTTFEIVLRGRASARLLRPLLDDFTITYTPGTHTLSGDTRLIGEVRDAAHLHGVVAHLTAVNVELISIVPVTAGLTPASDLTPEVQPEWSKS